MNVCIIPARGGSKRIPRKNIKKFLGIPIIKYSIDIALQTKIFDQVIVSTDDEEIRELSIKLGANVPFLRPSRISDDYTGIQEVICHSIEFLTKNLINPDFICCLLATAPFVTKEILVEGMNLLNDVDSDRFTFSATKYNFPIQRALRKDKFNLAYPINENDIKKRSQDLKESFHDAGQFYWGSRKSWLSKKNIFEKSMPLLLPSWQVQDLDTIEDWERAELMYKLIKEEKKL